MKQHNNKKIQIYISNFADIIGVHQRTLRIWDEKNILTPKRTEKNRRYYEFDDIKKAEFILFLTRNLFVNIAGVKIILGLVGKNGISLDSCVEYVDKIALGVDIGKEVQEENLIKSARKGRRKN